jgi:hypothetical protein
MNREDSLGKRKYVGYDSSLAENKRYLSEKMMEQLRDLSLVDSNFLLFPEEKQQSSLSNDGQEISSDLLSSSTSLPTSTSFSTQTISDEETLNSTTNREYQSIERKLYDRDYFDTHHPVRLHWNISDELRSRFSIPSIVSLTSPE